MTFPISDDRWVGRLRERLAPKLPDFLKSRRWFAGKSDALRSVEIWETIPLLFENQDACLFFVRVNYASGKVQNYALPLLVDEPGADHSLSLEPSDSHCLIEMKDLSPPCILRDALQSSAFAMVLLELIAQGVSLSGSAGRIFGCPRPAFEELSGHGEGSLNPSLMRVEQSNTSLRYGDRMILKVFRRLEDGKNLDLEVGAFLTEKAFFRNCPPVAGAIEYRRSGAPPVTLALLQGYIVNQGDAWRYTLQELPRHLEQFERREPLVWENARPSSSASWIDARIPVPAQEIMGAYLENIALLGRRTAELHLALASDPSDPDFRPEPFTPDFQEETSDSMVGLADRAFGLLRERLDFLPAVAREDARSVLALEKAVIHRFREIRDRNISALRARLHGDYHLGQVLYTGSDFFIIDFEGEPERPLAERRIKRSPLRDVAGMLRSFHYAAHTVASGRTRAGEITRKSGARSWRDWTSTEFLKAYQNTAEGCGILPRARAEMIFLLDLYLLEKSVYELVYELNNRPEWVTIPLDGILCLKKLSH